MGMWLLNHEFAAKVGWLKWDLLIKRNAMSIINYLYRVLCSKTLLDWHDDVIKWKHFSHCWPFVRGIPRSPENSPHKGQWRRALMFSLICVWVNNHKAGDLRRYRAHYDVSVMGPHIIWRILTHVHSPGLLGWHLLKCNSDNMFQLYCPACRTTLVATRFQVSVICPIIQVPHCIRVFFYFVWFVFINHIFQFYYESCTYCNILDIYLS